MTELDALMRQMIQADGPLSVAQYMQLALQHPTHGYYMKGDPLGVAGDFTTAPEISQMFGELVGLWCAEIWTRMDKPDPFVLLELGPGRGTLMQDALRATSKIQGFHAAMQLMLMESNQTLRAAQNERLAQALPAYLSELEALPRLPLIVIANEFLDALPVHQYVRTQEGWRERMVGLVDDKFTFVCDAKPVPLPLPDDQTFYEVSPLSLSFVQNLSQHMVSYGGAGLFIDYGDAERTCHDTLQAVSGHQSAPVLGRAGQVDLTAHVDFAALRLVAEKQGAYVTSCITQGEFLKSMGIELRAWQLKLNAGYDEAHQIDDALARLTGQGEMGALFKAMAFTAPTLHDVPGFP
ncbi:MAG: SAM-dependent methyltransferase [Alphaproteobacteria bacterium]|nr:SAM-dependent methyltransferase [Alphaproteobacteria bacterium]